MSHHINKKKMESIDFFKLNGIYYPQEVEIIAEIMKSNDHMEIKYEKVQKYLIDKNLNYKRYKRTEKNFNRYLFECSECHEQFSIELYYDGKIEIYLTMFDKDIHLKETHQFNRKEIKYYRELNEKYENLMIWDGNKMIQSIPNHMFLEKVSQSKLLSNNYNLKQYFELLKQSNKKSFET